ncbi:MAG: hypothetical protein P1U58_15125 [Verrucomicrobiales bacterium]|nr:hypothetical protein [Verrucomicrobiales bacterium]
MKGFFATLIVICLIVGGAWFAYEPYIKPLLEKGEIIATDETSKSNGGSEETPLDSGEGMKPAATSVPVAKTEGSKKSEIDLIIEEKYPMPAITPLMEIVDNWRNVPPRAFPSEVYATETVAFQLVVNGQSIGSSNVAPGTPLKPQSLSGDQLLIANAANPGMSTTISVDKTDFKDRISSRYNEFVEKVNAEVLAKRTLAREKLEADPSKLAALTGDAPVAVAIDPGDPKMSAVKASLTAGDVASVKLEEATSFTWNGTETVGGQFAGTYETATVNFEVATIFGTFPVSYKCLLQGGRVVAWIDPITEDPV